VFFPRVRAKSSGPKRDLQRIKERNLAMKLVMVRYFFNEKKGIFYYTADGRIDFRQLVKDLAKEFKMRIEMRQVGVRDEAKMVGGLGVCGRSLCCFSFMKSFEPVTIQRAKNLTLSLFFNLDGRKVGRF
jgi:cell fate regulator YaaT (PSP1 superfamily)